MKAEIGDIVLVNTEPPHLASVTDDNMVVCEDGTRMHIDDTTMSVMFKALRIVEELEKGVLSYNDTWRLCDSE